MIVSGAWKPPHAGDEAEWPDGKRAVWTRIAAQKDGSFDHAALRNAYLSITVECEADGVMMLQAAGHSMVYVNGEPRAGDPYSKGNVALPVRLARGANELLFLCQRGGPIRPRLDAPRGEVFLDATDATLPDLVVGEPMNAHVAIQIVNATTRPLSHVVRRVPPIEAGKAASAAATPGDGPKRATLQLLPTLPPLVPPLTTRKVALLLEGAGPTSTGVCRVPVEIESSQSDDSAPARRSSAATPIWLTFNVVAPAAAQRNRTFLSDIDGSVQYYAHRPAQAAAASQPAHDAARPGLVLTLHGAAVEASGQAACYGSRPWAHIVAPTNRRPFGFDWKTGDGSMRWRFLKSPSANWMSTRRACTSPATRWAGTGRGASGRRFRIGSPRSVRARAGAISPRTRVRPGRKANRRYWSLCAVRRRRATPAPWPATT